ncbi:MAG: PASTA domain-containing protein [Streptosporangiaceae bacterium]
MERAGRGEAGQVEVPQLVGMAVTDARQAGHRAGLVVVSADVDGPPLGGLTWPGVWVVTAQRPAPGSWLSRWDNVVIEFEELRGGEGAGDREPRVPLPDPGALAAEMETPDQPGTKWSRRARERP